MLLLRQGRRQTGPPSSEGEFQGSNAVLSLEVAHAGSRKACASNSRYLFIFVLLGGKPLRLIGGEARVALVGFVPLRLVPRPAARRKRVRLLRGGRPGRVGGAGDHPRSLQRHVVVRRFPRWMGSPFGEVSDGDSDVAWRGGRGLSIPALLSRDKSLCSSRCHSYVGRHGNRFGFFCGHRWYAAAFSFNGNIFPSPSLYCACVTF